MKMRCATCGCDWHVEELPALPLGCPVAWAFTWACSGTPAGCGLPSAFERMRQKAQIAAALVKVDDFMPNAPEAFRLVVAQRLLDAEAQA